MDYYFLEYLQADDAARFTFAPDPSISPGDWKTGSWLDTAPERPVRFRIRAGDEGLLPPYVDDPIPLMSDALIAALRGAGVDNLQLFEAIVQDAGSGTDFRNYRAVNILGLVDCAVDEEPASMLRPAIDAGRACDLPVFRLAGYAGRIVVHRRIKERLQSQPSGVRLDFRAASAIDPPSDVLGRE